MKKTKILIRLFIVVVALIIFILLNLQRYKINDSIVFIESISKESIKSGMGFVYKTEDKFSYIVTNYHVIYDSDKLYIYNLENKRQQADVILYDAYSDIAVIKMENNIGLKEVKVDNKRISVNDKVYYYDLNFNNIKSSIVLNLDEEIELNTDYGKSFYNVISIKGNIENGNSGGPIFNSKNSVVGLLSLKEDNSDVAFYMPIEKVMDIVNKLLNGELIRPNLGGVFANSTNTNILDKYGILTPSIDGVVVLEIKKGYVLDKSGVKSGDVITKINNIVVQNVSDLQKTIYSYNNGDKINIEYYRNSELNSIDVILSE